MESWEERYQPRDRKQEKRKLIKKHDSHLEHDDDYEDLAGRGLWAFPIMRHLIRTSAAFTLACIRSSIVHIVHSGRKEINKWLGRFYPRHIIKVER